MLKTSLAIFVDVVLEQRILLIYISDRRCIACFLDIDNVKQILCGDSASLKISCEYVILSFSSNDEDDDCYDDEEAVSCSLQLCGMSGITNGDYRVLNLRWFICIQSGELKDIEL